jgi:glycosyltransferase involved in cell wall biosynthesis
MREAECLVEDGFEVDFICLQDFCGKKESIKGVNLFRVNQKKQRGHNKYLYIFQYLEFFFRTLFLATSLYIKKRYSIVHVNNLPDFLVFTAIIPKIFGAKIILDIHDPMPELFSTKYEKKSNLAYSLLLKIESLSTRFADLVLSTGEPIKNDILIKHGILPSKIKIVSNFADQNLFQFNNDYRIDNKIKIIYHGTIAERFGIDDFLYSLIKVKNIDRFEFRIIGIGDYSNKIKDLIKELDLNDIVNFDNQVYNVKELPAILKEYHLGVISYKLSPATDYMLPLKLLEYFSLGIPVIAPRTKVISYYFDDDLLLYYKADSPNLISKILDKIADDPVILSRIRMKEYLFRHNYSWESEKIKYKTSIYSLMYPEKETAKCEGVPTGYNNINEVDKISNHEEQIYSDYIGKE